MYTGCSRLETPLDLGKIERLPRDLPLQCKEFLIEQQDLSRKFGIVRAEGEVAVAREPGQHTARSVEHLPLDSSRVSIAVAEFVELYNTTWRLEKIGYQTPMEAREEY